MAANDAFTAGVRPGGLTNSTEIRLLLCYLVKNAGPITRTEIENALMEEALVNYFEIGSCLDDIARQQLVTADGDRYTITCTVHTYNDGDLIACFNNDIPENVIKEIAKRKPLRAVFRDSGFKGSPEKINVGETFKLLSPDTRVKVI